MLCFACDCIAALCSNSLPAAHCLANSLEIKLVRFLAAACLLTQAALCDCGNSLCSSALDSAKLARKLDLCVRCATCSCSACLASAAFALLICQIAQNRDCAALNLLAWLTLQLRCNERVFTRYPLVSASWRRVLLAFCASLRSFQARCFGASRCLLPSS